MVSDPNAPKRPLSSYFKYMASVRDEIEVETGLKGIHAAKVISTKWKNLSSEEQAKFDNKAEMKVWQKKFQAYKKTQSYKDFQLKRRTKKLGKKPKDKNAPKRPMSAYFLFAQEERPKLKQANPDWGLGPIGKAVGEAWKKVSDSKKSALQAKYLKNKAAYDKKLAAYKKSENFKNWQKEVQTYKDKKAKLLGIKKPKAPKKSKKKAKKPKKKKSKKKTSKKKKVAKKTKSKSKKKSAKKKTKKVKKKTTKKKK